MSGTDIGPDLRLGRRREPDHIPVYRELFTCYQRVLGPTATLLWLNLRYLVHFGGGLSFTEALELAREALGVDQEVLEREVARLVEWGLLGPASDQDGVLLHEPLDEESFQALAENVTMAPTEAATAADDEPDVVADEPGAASHAFVGELETAAGASNAAKPPGVAEGDELARDLESVFQLYQQRIGLLGPMQYEKLRFWVEQMGMDAAVVGMAIDETARSAENPRINYLEGILRNWHNDGLRTAADLVRYLARQRKLDARGRTSSTREVAPAPETAPRPATTAGIQLHGKVQRPRVHPQSVSYEGVPNAGAYRKVDSELVKRWKEMYPDEYDDE